MGRAAVGRPGPWLRLWFGLGLGLGLTAGCGAKGYTPPPLPLDAGLVGETAARPLAVVADRGADRLEFYAIWPNPLGQVASLSLDDHPGFVDEPFDLAVAPDGASLYVVLGHGDRWERGKLVRIRLADGVRTGEVSLGEEPSMVALSADGRRAYVTLFRNLAHPQGPWSDPGALVVVDTEAMIVQGQAELCAAPLGVALDEARGRVWVACAGSDELALVDVSAPAAPRLDRLVALDDGRPGAGQQPAYVALSEHNAYVSAQGSGEVWTFDRESAVMKRRLALGSESFPQRLLVLYGDRALVALGGAQSVAVFEDRAGLWGTISLPGRRPQGLARADFLVTTDEGDLSHPGRLVESHLCSLDIGPIGELCTLDVSGEAPTSVFPQAVVVVR